MKRTDTLILIKQTMPDQQWCYSTGKHRFAQKGCSNNGDDVKHRFDLLCKLSCVTFINQTEVT